MISQGSPSNLFNSVTTSNMAILASLKRQGLPSVDRDGLQTQLVPFKSISQTESPLKLNLEPRVRTPSLPAIQLTNRQNRKKKVVAFVEEDLVLETPKHKPNRLHTERSPTNQFQKGILIKKRKYSDHADEMKEHANNENKKEINVEVSDNNINDEETERQERIEKNGKAPSFLDLVKDNTKIPKNVFQRPHRVKKSLTEEFGNIDLNDKPQKEERLVDSLRKNFDFGLPKEDFTLKKNLSSFLSPKIVSKSDAISIFKSSNNKEIFSPLKLKNHESSPRIPQLAKNTNKVQIPSFNVGSSNETPRNEQNSPRLLNGHTQTRDLKSPTLKEKVDNIKLKRMESEEKFPVIESPFENFHKKHMKTNSVGYDGRNQFVLNAANSILKADNFRIDNRMGLLPKLDIFNDYRRSLPGSYNNTPRKY